MKYILLILLTGIFMWPYTCRFKSFSWTWGPLSWTLSTLPASTLATGIIMILQSGPYPVQTEDIMARAVGLILWAGLLIWHTWLMCTANWRSEYGTGDDIEFFVLSLFISVIVSTIMTKVVMAILQSLV